MIFSFGENLSEFIPFEIMDTDIFCLFRVTGAVLVPPSEFSHSVISSLKLKKNVLIIESGFRGLASMEFSQRWFIGKDFLWLSPRSLNLIKTNAQDNFVTYEFIRTFLAASN